MNDEGRRQPAATREWPDTADRPAAEQAVAPRIAALAEAAVDGCSRHARAVVAGCLVLTLLFGWYMATHLGLATDTDRLIDPSAPWRKGEVELAQLFPQNNPLLVI